MKTKKSSPVDAPASRPDFATRYPNIAGWIEGDGWIELGSTQDSPSMARALDEGGMVWEGKTKYKSIDDLLDDLEAGIAQWLEENG